MEQSSYYSNLYMIQCYFIFFLSVISASGHFSLMAVWHSSRALVLINEVNLRRARLELRWVTVSGFNPRCPTFISVCNQPPRPSQLPSLRDSKWGPASARKEKAGMVHSVSGWTRGMQVKLYKMLSYRRETALQRAL